MKAKSYVVSVLAVLLALQTFSSSALAQSKILSADYAVKGSRCIETNNYSFSSVGPLQCIKGSWKLVPSSQDTVATRAYRYLLERYNKMPSTQPNLIVRADPAAGQWKNKLLNGFVAAARLWGTSKPTDAPLPLYISESAEYISSQLAKDGIKENPDDAARNRTAVAQRNTQAGSHGQYFDFLFYDEASHDSGFYQVGSHEYTHYAVLTLSNHRFSYVPREFWMEEGCATFVGMSMGGINGFPQNLRAKSVEKIQSSKAPFYLSDFSQKNESAYSNPRFNQIFDSGYMGCEALVAAVGIDGLEKMYTALATEGETYETVSLSVFNMNLSDLVSFSQNYLDSVRKKKPQTLAVLLAEFKKRQTV